MPRRTIRAVLTPPLLVAAFLILVWEETVWRWAKALGALVARLPLMAAVERVVARLDARLVFLLFLIPMALLFPLKLLALWLIATGRPLLGIGVVVAAKMLGTAVSARLYVVAEPRLMEIRAFVWLHGRVTGWLRAAHEFLDASPGWQAARRALHALKGSLRAMVAPLRGVLRSRAGGLVTRLGAMRRWLARR
jgi:hypothetical protein